MWGEMRHRTGWAASAVALLGVCALIGGTAAAMGDLSVEGIRAMAAKVAVLPGFIANRLTDTLPVQLLVLLAALVGIVFLTRRHRT